MKEFHLEALNNPRLKLIFKKKIHRWGTDKQRAAIDAVVLHTTFIDVVAELESFERNSDNVKYMASFAAAQSFILVDESFVYNKRVTWHLHGLDCSRGTWFCSDARFFGWSDVSRATRDEISQQFYDMIVVHPEFNRLLLNLQPQHRFEENR